MTIKVVNPRSFSHRLRLLCGVAIIGIVLCLWGFFSRAEHEIFFRAYLVAWLFFLGLALGGLAVVMIHNLTGGPWGDGSRIIGRAASLTLPLVAVLFIPVLFGLTDLYGWARPAEAAASATWRHRAVYLNVPFFIARAAIYFILWSGIAWLLARWQGQWQRTLDARVAHRIRGLSAAGLIIYLFTMTHAGIDWIVSRDATFYSTASGFILTVGQTLSAFAFAIVLFSPTPPRRDAAAETSAPRNILSDMGSILLVLVILWIYVSFMEFLVIWMGNMREDGAWFVHRGLSEPSAWRWVGLGLIVCQFFVPFYLLLFRAAKERARVLKGVAWLVLAAHAVEVYWLIAPSVRGAGPRFEPSWMDGAAFLAVGGAWLACFFLILRRRAGLADELPVIVARGPEGEVA